MASEIALSVKLAALVSNGKIVLGLPAEKRKYLSWAAGPCGRAHFSAASATIASFPG